MGRCPGGPVEFVVISIGRTPPARAVDRPLRRAILRPAPGYSVTVE